LSEGNSFEAARKSLPDTFIFKQFFNAVDRFHGRVANSALYNVRAGMAQLLTFKLEIDTQRLNSSDNSFVHSIMVLLLTDASHGDLGFGGSAAKGYGTGIIKQVSPIAKSLPDLEQAIDTTVKYLSLQLISAVEANQQKSEVAVDGV